MAPTSHDETERKYDVDDAAIVPNLTEVDGVAAVGQAVTYDLEAVYFDTAGLDLARHRVTLRRRTGGPDSGWHLKLPARGDTRTEVRLPLDTPPLDPAPDAAGPREGAGGPREGQAPEAYSVPAALLGPVRAIVRDRALQPVAHLQTRRLAYTLRDDQATDLAELSDDTVTAERLVAEPAVEHWREWEVELVEGSETLLDAVEEVLLGGGAAPASARSKLARTLGDAVRPPDDQPPTEDLGGSTAADVLRAHLAKHTASLWEQDARVREDQPGAIHKFRIAARRLRSALTTYRPLFQAGSVDPLREQLRWLGQTLGGARDAQVLRERLDELVESQPAELVLGPVAARIDGDLAYAYRDGRERSLALLDSERYFRLLDSLDDLVQSPPLLPEAGQPASEVLPRLLARDTKRLRRAVRAAKAADHPDQRDPALHEARKKAKRLRYAADSTVPVFGKPAEKLSAAAKRVQNALGLHQDAIVAGRRLREYAVQAHLAGENGFTFGRLHALEEWRAEEARQAFRKAWKKTPHRKIRRWVTE
jgi:CHAD domain-containing protein